MDTGKLNRFARRIFLHQNKITIASDSMKPRLKKGDTVIVLLDIKPKFGDIICYIRENRVIVHRYYFSLCGKILTKGDALGYFDRLWEKQHYIGKIQINVPLIEKTVVIFQIMNNSPGILPLIFKKIFKRKNRIML